MSETTELDRKGTSAGNRRDAQREVTRARLFDETIREFQKTGFADTEVAVITERVGVSRGAFYVYFAGKDAVLSELLLREEHRITVKARPLVEQGRPVADVLGAIVDAVFDAERRLGRRLVQDLCGAQFRPELVQANSEQDHPVLSVVIDAFAAQAQTDDAGDRAVVFLTSLFGLLATADGSRRQRRSQLDLLVDLVSGGSSR